MDFAEFARAVFALALVTGTTATLTGGEGTAGSLGGYHAVWLICGLTALVSAVLLAFVPRLAFSDTDPGDDAAAGAVVGPTVPVPGATS